ncbi:hypothetical protein DBA26_07515 [Brucella canis]|uniref:Uncharacterized protein n=3 Tax=Brucella TaxID=234 RepID=A0AAI8EBJ3_BRUSS|nr:hypothetical protein CRN66_02370 [Brucella canis]ATQ53607.1 hypothetical protein CS875_13135 [Brucella suis]EEX88817.1 predicted protein [Brucella ceti M13/05/1]EEX96217.1 predicted protein [Brucella ceti M644/93/1]EEY02091.1 predicted protein [Brucella pinnipedialis B2/94]EEY05914.1 predicted protein [Brucella pinnipedialis M163/99/10]EEY24676.1 predicted protein [Brucella sp. F5/99]EEY27933.1 predicted protein [Brucella suis bv. 5 str. 513]EEY31205.1 predicted protein [Brucella suis bv
MASPGWKRYVNKALSSGKLTPLHKGGSAHSAGKCITLLHDIALFERIACAPGNASRHMVNGFFSSH